MCLLKIFLFLHNIRARGMDLVELGWVVCCCCLPARKNWFV